MLLLVVEEYRRVARSSRRSRARLRQGGGSRLGLDLEGLKRLSDATEASVEPGGRTFPRHGKRSACVAVAETEIIIFRRVKRVRIADVVGTTFFYFSYHGYERRPIERARNWRFINC